MAEALYLITKTSPGGPEKTLIDGIHSCLINSDNGGSDATKIAEAEAKIQAAGHAIPSGYFDTVTAIADLSAGPLDTDEDVLLILPRSTQYIVTA